MTPVPSVTETEDAVPGLVLENELHRPGRSISWLARELAGENPTDKTVENRRRYLQKVVGNPDWTPTPRMAEKLASSLEIDPSRLLRARPARRARAVPEQLAERLEELVDRGEALASRLEGLLDAEPGPRAGESADRPGR
jgi:hypothetical protein